MDVYRSTLMAVMIEGGALGPAEPTMLLAKLDRHGRNAVGDDEAGLRIRQDLFHRHARRRLAKSRASLGKIDNGEFCDHHAHGPAPR